MMWAEWATKKGHRFFVNRCPLSRNLFRLIVVAAAFIEYLAVPIINYAGHNVPQYSRCLYHLDHLN